jgi:hypothetical protein
VEDWSTRDAVMVVLVAVLIGGIYAVLLVWYVGGFCLSDVAGKAVC